MSPPLLNPFTDGRLKPRITLGDNVGHDIDSQPAKVSPERRYFLGAQVEPKDLFGRRHVLVKDGRPHRIAVPSRARRCGIDGSRRRDEKQRGRNRRTGLSHDPPNLSCFANGDSKGYVAFCIACLKELLMFLPCGADDDRRRTPCTEGASR